MKKVFDLVTKNIYLHQPEWYCKLHYYLLYKSSLLVLKVKINSGKHSMIIILIYFKSWLALIIRVNKSIFINVMKLLFYFVFQYKDTWICTALNLVIQINSNFSSVNYIPYSRKLYFEIISILKVWKMWVVFFFIYWMHKYKYNVKYS